MIGEIIQRVKDGMVGRMCDEFDNVRLLLETVRDAGDGDYLEIGVLHGGSLCAVALLKQALGHTGKCVGIDPLNGFYMQYLKASELHPKMGHKIDYWSQTPVTYDVVHENVNRFDLDNVEILITKSDPFPKSARRDFVVAYIDGDHWGDAPTIDWVNVNPLVTRFVVFDNHDEKHPDVKRACQMAEQDENWERYLQQGITFILQRLK